MNITESTLNFALNMLTGYNYNAYSHVQWYKSHLRLAHNLAGGGGGGGMIPSTVPFRKLPGSA